MCVYFVILNLKEKAHQNEPIFICGRGKWKVVDCGDMKWGERVGGAFVGIINCEILLSLGINYIHDIIITCYGFIFSYNRRLRRKGGQFIADPHSNNALLWILINNYILGQRETL